MEQAGYLVQQILNAFQIALFYALIAVAYVLFHGVTGRFNLAFGALATWAGYLTIGVLVSELAWRGVPQVALLALALAAGVGASLIIGRTVAASVFPIVAMPALAILVATLGWAIALEDAVRLAAGSRELWLSPILAAPLMSLQAGESLLQVTGMQVLIWSLGLGALAAVLALVRFSQFGREWRAVSQDPVMASLLGVDVRRVYLTTALLGAALAGLCGALAGLAYGNASFHGGFILAMKALFVAIIGGLHAPGRAVVAALLLALLESLWSAYFPGDYRDVVVFAVLAAIVVCRPAGVAGFASAGSARV